MVNTRRHVLLVDDDDSLRDLVSSRLEAEGYGTIEAQNGQEALDYLFAPGVAEPSCVLLDLVMPVMSGTELLSVFDRYARLRRIPVIVLSSERPRSSLGLRYVAWLQKPQELRAIVDEVRAHALASDVR